MLSRESQKPCGLSLAEVMVGSAVLLLVTSIAFTALKFAINYQKRIEAQQVLSERTLDVLYKVEKELEESNIDLVLVEPTRNSVSFLAPRDASGNLTTVPETGALVWGLAVNYTVEENQLVRRQNILADPSASPINPLRLGLSADAFLTQAPDQMLARGCVSFVCEFADRLQYVGTTSDGTAAEYVPPEAITGQPEPREEPSVLELRVKLEEKGDKVYSVTAQSTVFPRN